MNPNERGQGVGIRCLSGPILVPMDGTEVSEGILPWVARIAGQADARLILLTAVDPDGIEYPPVGPPAQPDWAMFRNQVEENSRTHAQDALRAVVEWLRIRGVSAEGRAILGNPAEEIVRVSEDEGCGLIAMSTHGRNFIGRSILGSVTDRVLHSASVPVLTITPDRARMYQEEGTTLNTVVVPLDGSELAELALPYAEELATALSLEVLLVRVARTDHLAFSYEEFAGRIPDFTSDLEREAARYLEAVSEGLRNRGLAVRHRVLGGAPAPSLLDLARGDAPEPHRDDHPRPLRPDPVGDGQRGRGHDPRVRGPGAGGPPQGPGAIPASLLARPNLTGTAALLLVPPGAGT